MSIPEYGQRAEDHRSILLLIKSISDDPWETSALGQTISQSSTSSEINKYESINEQNLQQNRNGAATITTEVANAAERRSMFNQIFEKLSRIEEIKIKEPNLGYERTVRLRFKKQHYEVANNEWGDFQAHRKLFGVITVGQFSTTRHLRSIEQYNGLYDSRCFLIKPSQDSTTEQRNSKSACSLTDIHLSTKSTDEIDQIDPIS
jgi:hypothetical protein